MNGGMWPIVVMSHRNSCTLAYHDRGKGRERATGPGGSGCGALNPYTAGAGCTPSVPSSLTKNEVDESSMSLTKDY